MSRARATTWGLGFEREMMLMDGRLRVPPDWAELAWELPEAMRKDLGKGAEDAGYVVTTDVINTNDYAVPCVEVTSTEFEDADFDAIVDAVAAGTRHFEETGNRLAQTRAGGSNKTTTKPQAEYRPGPLFRRPGDGGLNHAGSQHFWYTLPHPRGTKPEQEAHLLFARWIQWLEPLLAGLATVPHPRAGPEGAGGLTQASVRAVQNVHGGWGTLDTATVDTGKLMRRLRRLGFSREEVSFLTLLHSRTHAPQMNDAEERPAAVVNMPNARHGTFKFGMVPRSVYEQVRAHHPDVVPKHGADLRFGSILSQAGRSQSRGLEVRVCDLIDDADSRAFFKLLALVGAFAQSSGVALAAVPVPQESAAWNDAMAATLKFGWSAALPLGYLRELARLIRGAGGEKRGAPAWPRARDPRACMEVVVERVRAAMRARRAPHPWRAPLLGNNFTRRVAVPNANFQHWARTARETEGARALAAWLEEEGGRKPEGRGRPPSRREFDAWFARRVREALPQGRRTPPDALRDLHREYHFLAFGSLPEAAGRGGLPV